MTQENDNAQKLRSLARRGVVHAINDNGAGQSVTVETHAGYPRSNVPVHQQFGLSSRAPAAGAVTHVLASGGDEADLIALPPSNPSIAHMGELSEGETVLYDAVGQAVYLENGKFVRVLVNEQLSVEISGATVFSLTQEKALFNVPLEVQGGIKASDDIIAGTVSLQNHLHGGVQKGGDQTGKPQA